MGKVGQLFAGVGIDVEHPGATNARALDETTELIAGLDHGFVFTNLIETDQVYGHRHDFDGFAGALGRIDERVARWLALLRDDDLLVLTADHGCDLTSPRTDHTREQVAIAGPLRRPRRPPPRRGPRRRRGQRAGVGGRRRGRPDLPGRSFL